MATGQGTTAFEWSNYYRSALTSDITASATDIFLDAVPSAAEGILVIDPDSSANREIIFYNSKTATKVTCPSAALGRGYDTTTAVAHTAGTKVIMVPVGDMFRMLKNLTLTPDDAIKPRYLAGGTGTSWAWQTWTPTWTNLTVGNGTNNSKYMQIGKTVFYTVAFTLGSTSTVGTNPIHSLPVTSVVYPNTVFPIAQGKYFNGTGNYNAVARWASTTTSGLDYWDVNNNTVGVTATLPGTWAAGWGIFLQGFYEAA